MSSYDDVMGEKAPEPTPGQKDPKYTHWCNPGSGREVGEWSADKKAMESNNAGMQGKENPYVPYVDRERGDQSAKGRDNRSPGVADPDWFTSQFQEDK